MVDVVEMRARDGCASEVEFCIFVLDGVLGESLMEGSVAVDEDGFGPTCEDVLVRVVGEYSEELVALGPIEAAA